MGVKGSAALRARQREVADRVERLISHADQQAPAGPTQRANIKAGIRSGLAAMRRSERAHAAAAGASTDIGVALTQLVASGLTHAQAFEALGLTVGVGRRLLREANAPQERRTGSSSTGSGGGLADAIPASQPDRDSHRDARIGVD